MRQETWMISHYLQKWNDASMLQKTRMENTKNIGSFSNKTKFEQTFKKLNTKSWVHLLVQIAFGTNFITMENLNLQIVCTSRSLQYYSRKWVKATVTNERFFLQINEKSPGKKTSISIFAFHWLPAYSFRLLIQFIDFHRLR